MLNLINEIFKELNYMYRGVKNVGVLYQKIIYI